MRNYLTPWLWYEDRLCSLPSVVLVFLCSLCFAGLGLLGFVGFEFFDDLAYLMAENDLRSAIIVSELVVASASALWVISCCLVELGNRLIRRFRHR